MTVLQVIASPRTSAKTRAVLLSRVSAGQITSPFFTGQELEIARALMDTLLPQNGFESVDLAMVLDETLSNAKGDGWRYAALPDDGTAARLGLAALNRLAGEQGFAALSGEARRTLIAGALRGEVQWPDFALSLWLEDLLAAAVLAWVSDPRGMAALGYDGFADDAGGWERVGLGSAETWEPRPA